MSDENRTPSAWAAHCLEVLQTEDPSYRKNREAKGRFMEFVRQDESGLAISHNFIKIRDTYYYSYGLLFTQRPTLQLSHALLAGSRFDHNRTIWRQFYDDLNLSRGDVGFPSGVWSFGAWRNNTLENLSKGLLIPDRHLYPVYREALANGKSRLVALFREAKKMMDQVPPNEDIDAVAQRFSHLRSRHEQFQRECCSLGALSIGRGGLLKFGYGPPEPGFRFEDVPLELIVFSQLSVFFKERDRLDEIISIAERL